MKSCLYRILSLSSVIVLLGGDVSARYSESADHGGSDKYEENGSSRDYGVGVNESRADQGEMQEADLYPFTKSQGRIEDKDVVGIRIFGKKLVLLGENKTYSEEQRQEQDFSEFDFFSRYPKLISVDISNMELTREVLKNLRRYLPKTIKSLIVNSCSIANRDFEEFTDIITRRNQLESLTVTNPNMAQAESAKLITAIENLKVIKYLKLTLGELGVGGCDILKKVLEKSKETLLELSLGFRRVDDSESYDKLLEFVGELKKLKGLEYSVIESTEKQVKNFFGSLAKLEELTDLKIYFDDFNSHDGVEAYHNAEGLNEAMKNLTELESLDISNMNLPDSALQIISRALQDLTKLKTLNISGNPIDVKVAKVLAESLKGMDSLAVFIANNCEISDEAFSSLCSGLQSSSLQYMHFSRNDIAGSVKSLPVSQMKNLTAVNFAHNKIKLSDVVGFMETIPEGSKLEIVNWEGNDFKGISDSQRTEEMNKLKIWKKEHGVSTLDLGI